MLKCFSEAYITASVKICKEIVLCIFTNTHCDPVTLIHISRSSDLAIILLYTNYIFRPSNYRYNALDYSKGALAIRRVFSLVGMIFKLHSCFEIGAVRQQTMHSKHQSTF